MRPHGCSEDFLLAVGESLFHHEIHASGPTSLTCVLVGPSAKLTLIGRLANVVSWYGEPKREVGQRAGGLVDHVGHDVVRTGRDETKSAED